MWSIFHEKLKQYYFFAKKFSFNTVTVWLKITRNTLSNNLKIFQIVFKDMSWNVFFQLLWPRFICVSKLTNLKFILIYLYETIENEKKNNMKNVSNSNEKRFIQMYVQRRNCDGTETNKTDMIYRIRAKKKN